MDKSPVRKNERRREKDRFKEGTNQIEVAVLQEALIEKNHFEESLNLPEYPRKPSMVAASDSVGKHCERRMQARKREREVSGKRKKRRMEVSGTEYYA